MSSLLVPSHTILVQFTGQVSHSITAKQGRFLAKMLCYTGYGGVEAMNRRAFLARVFTVAAATSTFALGPSPTSANRLEPVRIADTKAIASSADVMPTTTESPTIASSVGVA